MTISDKAKAFLKSKEEANQALIDSIEAQFVSDVGWKLPFFAARPHWNPVTKTRYKGMNTFTLTMATCLNPSYSNGWLTFKQGQELGLTLKDAKGKGVSIVYWFRKATKDTEDLDDSDPNKKFGYFPKYFTVFNESLFFNEDGTPFATTQALEAKTLTLSEQRDLLLSFADRTNVKVNHVVGKGAAYYVNSTRQICLPPFEEFVSEEAYIATLAHELVHSTKDELRSNWERDVFGSVPYAKEEVVAELGATLVSSMLGIEKLPLDNHAAYIKGWLEKAKSDDPNFFAKAIKAASQVQDYVFDILYPESELVSPKSAEEVA